MATVKELLASHGVEELNKFCDVNGIPVPKLHIITDPSDVQYQKIQRIGTCGYYRGSNIYVGVGLCAHQNPMYSWPAYISDRTPFGVIEHELGHHVDEMMSGFNIYRHQPKVTMDNLAVPSGMFSDRIRQQSGEPAITSYSPNTMEWFAEIFRLFVTNPDLLTQIRPKAYKALIDSGLKPITNESFDEVLDKFKAPPKIYGRLVKTLTLLNKRK